VWWCLYILDRRLAIEGGHPFLISDVDISAPLPRISDDIFGASGPESSRPTCAQPEASSNPIPIPYIIAMAEYSKVLGKVWEAVYSAGTSINTNPSLCEHLEQFLFCAQKQIPPIFRYYPDADRNIPPATAPWWLTKQQALMQVVGGPVSPLSVEAWLNRLAMAVFARFDPQAHAAEFKYRLCIGIVDL
jgi:hypothetical protein